MTTRTLASRTAPWLALLASSSVIAQQAEPTSTPSGEVEEIVVTGSRIARPDYSSTSPIVTFGQEQITQTGTVNIENALNQLPQFVQGQMQSTIGAVALAGRASLNLRGLGETRNLVLLDGRRLPLSNANAVVDVNLIPQFILGGVETITGGASAVYGSDAMSGVVNFKSRDHFEGIQLDVRSGISDRGDAKTADYGDHGRIRHFRGTWQRAALGRLHRSRCLVGQRSRLLPTRRPVILHWSRHLRPGADEFADSKRSSTRCSATTVLRRVECSIHAVLASMTTARCSGRSVRSTTRDRRRNSSAPLAPTFANLSRTRSSSSTRWNANRSSGSSTMTYGQPDRLRSVSVQQDDGNGAGRLVADAVRGPHGAGDQSVHPRGFAHHPRITATTDRRLHDEPAISWGWSSGISLRTSRWGNTSLGCAATCRSRIGAGTSTALTTLPTWWRRRTRRYCCRACAICLTAPDGGASICAGGFNPFGLGNCRPVSPEPAAPTWRRRRTTTRS